MAIEALTFKILDADLENGTLVIEWNGELTLSHSIPDEIDEAITTEELLEHVRRNMAPWKELDRRRMLKERRANNTAYIDRLKSMIGTEWTVERPAADSAENNTSEVTI